MQHLSLPGERPRRRREDLALGWLLGTDPRAHPSLARLAGETGGPSRGLLPPASGASPARDDSLAPGGAALPDAWLRLWRRSLFPERLIDFHDALSRATSAREICDALARHATLTVGAYQAVVLLPESDGAHLGVAGWWSNGAPPPEVLLPGRIARGAPRLVDPAAVDAAGDACPGLAPLSRIPGVSTLALVPIGERGLLLLSERRAERIFSEDDWTLLEALALHADRALASVTALAEARRAALVDPLTGLANRRHLEVVLRHAWAGAERGEGLTLMLLDLDDFKAINDRHGHAMGDDVLRVVGEVLRGETRGSDTVVRYGGDEFLVVLPRQAASAARRLFERIRARLDGWAGVSAGIAEYHPALAAPCDLVEAADEDLYARKRQ